MNLYFRGKLISRRNTPFGRCRPIAFYEMHGLFKSFRIIAQKRGPDIILQRNCGSFRETWENVDNEMFKWFLPLTFLHSKESLSVV